MVNGNIFFTRRHVTLGANTVSPKRSSEFLCVYFGKAARSFFHDPLKLYFLR